MPGRARRWFRLVVNARLLGLGRRAPLSAFGLLFPIMWAGFTVNAISGFILFAIAATVNAVQVIFWIKLSLIALALVVTAPIVRIVKGAGETLHFIGLALLIGATGFFDLRLLGIMKRVPMTVARQFMPLALCGFGLNLTTGILFFLAQPSQYVLSWAWWGKVAFLMVAGLDAMFFEITQGARVLAIGEGEDTPLTFKVVGAISLVAWFAVLYFGRMLPFFAEIR